MTDDATRALIARTIKMHGRADLGMGCTGCSCLYSDAEDHEDHLAQAVADVLAQQAPTDPKLTPEENGRLAELVQAYQDARGPNTIARKWQALTGYIAALRGASAAPPPTPRDRPEGLRGWIVSNGVSGAPVCTPAGMLAVFLDKADADAEAVDEAARSWGSGARVSEVVFFPPGWNKAPSGVPQGGDHE